MRASSPPVASIRAPGCCWMPRRHRLPMVTCSISAADTGRSPLVLAKRAPQARVWAVDVNQRALDLCARERGIERAGQRPLHPDRRRWHSRCWHRRVRPSGQLPADLVEPADPDRQAGAAFHADALARAAWRPARPPTWWSSAISAQTRCSAGWARTAGTPPDLPPARATGCWRYDGEPAAARHDRGEAAQPRLAPAHAGPAQPAAGRRRPAVQRRLDHQVGGGVRRRGRLAVW